MNQLARIAGSFALVLVVYATYAVTAVPLIEPSIDETRSAGASTGAIPSGETQTSRQVAELSVLFPPGSPYLNNPKILQSDRVKLLIGDYQPDPRDNTRVEIRPFAVVLLPQAKNLTPAEQLKQAVVLEALHGALLQFDERFDLGRAKIGRLISGRLDGPIVIRSAGGSGDTSDDLLVTTRDVQLSEQRITTDAPVEFRRGPNFGSGRGLVIRLLPGDAVGQQRGPNIGGLESFTLASLDRLHLQLPKRSMSLESLAGAGEKPSPQGPLPDGRNLDRANGSESGAADGVPVDIACAGEFCFDAVRQEATFNDRVTVISTPSAGGPSDEINNCDRLAIYFSRRGGVPASGAVAGRSPAKSANLDQLQPCRLAAKGRPVVFLVPSESAEGRAERIEYNLVSKDVAMEGETMPVFLRQGGNRIEARCLHYASPEPPLQIGRVAAAGPGWIRAEAGDQLEQPFTARWNGELRVRPYQQNQVISLTGGAELLYGGLGQLSAGEIHFYFFERPGPNGSQRVNMQPDRLGAETNVRLDSPRASGAIEQLQVWFEPKATDPVATSAEGWSSSPEETASNGTTSRGPSAPGDAASNGAEPNRHFHVTGRLLQARVLFDKSKADMDELTVRDRVELVETQTAKPEDKPIVVRGELIHVKDASKPYATVSVKGAPAQFTGREMALSGASIDVNGGTNRLDIQGAGWMDLPAMKQRGIDNRPTDDAGPMRVHWRDRMGFDGRTARFEGQVRAVSQLQQLSADTIEATLDRMIRFTEGEKLDNPADVDLQELRCQSKGGEDKVWMETRSFKQGLQQSYLFVEAVNLVVNNTSGDLTAAGPGAVRSVVRSAGGMSRWTGLTGLQKNPKPPGPDNNSASKDTLTYLHVRFLEGMTGNIHRHELTFHGQIRTIFGPVESWEETLPEDNPDAWGPDGGQLTTDQLTVREMPSPIGQQSSVELEAIGNTRIEGRDYAAFGTRMSYDESKGVMFLQGDGRTNATLLRQKEGGRLSTQWIRFWPKTKQVQSGGFGSIEINQTPGTSTKPQRSTGPRP